MQLARSPKAVALLLAVLLATPLLAGCNANDSATGDASTSTAQEEAQGTSSDGSGDASDGTEGEAVSFSYDTYLDENGHWKDVTALDYVTLPDDYASIAIPSDEVVPTDDDVQGQIDYLASSFATTEQVTDRAVEDGDTVNIDYVGTIDGVEFEGGNTNGAGTDVTIGVTNYIDDFLDQLVGHTPGETFDVEVTFPEDYGVDELNGKDAVFSTTINYIEEQVTPEIDDAWVEENLSSSYGWTTVDEMRENIFDSLQANNVANYVQAYVTEGSEVTEVPEVIIESQRQLTLSQYQGYADTYGMTLKDMLAMVSGAESVEEFLELGAEGFEQTARSYLVYQAIAEDAGIDPTEDDVLAYFQSIMNVEDLTDLESAYGMPYLKLCTLVQQVEDMLTDGATIE